MKDKLIQQIKDIKIKKNEVVKSKAYEEAAILRDKEKELMEKLKEIPEYKDRYFDYIHSKVKEFEDIITVKDGRGVMEFFNYVIKNIGSDYFNYCKKTQFEFNELKHLTFQEIEKGNKQDNIFLNKWILNNFISFDDWFSVFMKETASME
jgi:hypothetical protein